MGTENQNIIYLYVWKKKCQNPLDWQLLFYLYLQSLGILASIPAAILIVSLVGLLLYLLTRCCDRKQRKSKTHTCQNCTLITTTLLCCAAIGLGMLSLPYISYLHYILVSLHFVRVRIIYSYNREERINIIS